MPPTSDRDFLSAAGQRLEAARALFHGGLTLDAQYLGGYVVECSIKAVILHHTAYGGLLSSCRQAAALVTGGPGGPPGRLRIPRPATSGRAARTTDQRSLQVYAVPVQTAV